MKNTIKVLGNLTRARSAKVPLVIIALVAVIGFGMTACDDGSKDDNDNNDDGGQGVTVTFSIDKVSATSFTVTVEGRTWESEMDNPYFGAVGRVFDENTRNVSVTGLGGSTNNYQIISVFAITRTDTVLTYVLNDTYYSSASGTITLNNSYGILACVIGGDSNKDTVIINPAKSSITLP